MMRGSLHLQQPTNCSRNRSCGPSSPPFKARAASFSLQCSTQHSNSAALQVLSSRSLSPATPSWSSRSLSARRGSSCICRDAVPPRPMWAAKTAPVPAGPAAAGSNIAAMITKDITVCSTVPELQDVYNEWGGTFDAIAAAAALAKYAKLQDAKADSPFLARLLSTWQSRLPDAGLRACANVLWALGRLRAAAPTSWDSTWEAYMQLLDNELHNGDQCDMQPQQLSHALLASAKARKQPAAADMQLLMQALLHPSVLRSSDTQLLSNAMWAISQLHQSPGWQDGVSEQDLQQLLGEQQLQVLATEGAPQAVSNVLLSLGRLATGSSPVLRLSFAQQTAQQLMAVRRVLDNWDAQSITNSMWACAALGLTEEPFIRAAVAAAPTWLPKVTGFELNQAFFACAKLHIADQHFMSQLLQRGQQLLSQKPGRGSRYAQSGADGTAAICTWSVAQLNMQQLAEMARDIVAISSIAKQPRSHPANLRRLWVFHSWLLEHQLLDGRGLTGLLTKQQLQLGAEEAAKYGRN